MIAPPGIVQGKKILLADDQQDVRESIEMLLTVDGHTVVQASNGKEALEAFRKDTFDLVITDHAMPQMKGSELAVNIKHLAPDQPIIMITAYAEKLRNAENPVNVILNKPFTLEDLRRSIAELLGRGASAR